MYRNAHDDQPFPLTFFSEKGYCMRGDLCPYDHGTDPVVLEDVALSRVLTFGPHGAQAPGAVPVAAGPEAPPGPGGVGPNGNAPPPHMPLASLPPPHLRNQHHANMGSCFISPPIHSLLFIYFPLFILVLYFF